MFADDAGDDKMNDETLAEAGWAADILGPDTFAELQDHGEVIAAGQESFMIKAILTGDDMVYLLEAYTRRMRNTCSDDDLIAFEVFAMQIMTVLYASAVKHDLVSADDFWVNGDSPPE